MPTLNWIGKEKIINHHNDVPFRMLDKKYTFGGETSQNMIIHGDNLYALKSLLPRFEGKVDLIYIDPPYNTGNEKWVYNDNVNDPRILKWLGQVVGSEGEDLSRHDKWLCMMYPRLKLLHKLLSDKGAIMISIDNNEVTSLKIICDEIFGASNYVETIIWNKKSGAKGVPPKNMIVNVHEYILVYQKTNQFSFKGEYRDAEKEGFKNPDNDPRGPWRMSNIKSTTKAAKDAFTITDPNTGRQYTNTWAFSKESLDRMIAENRILWKETLPKQKEFFNELTNENKAIKSSWGVFDPQSTTMYLKDIMPEEKFDNPKPIALIDYIIDVATNKNSIILDSFAGSGTTGHSVLNINEKDGGHRRFILIEMMDYAETITARRIKNVIQEKQTPLFSNESFNYSFYELGEPILKDDGNINPNVSEIDVKRFIYYSEVHEDSKNESESPFMGSTDSTSYYVFYKKNEITCLNYELLSGIENKSDSYVIYADTCTLSKSFMETHHIVFKKIPRDIQKI